MNAEEIKIAKANFKKRKKENEGKQINNSDLRAGSPMYFYCLFCGILTDTMPESYVGQPVKVCKPCEKLHELGEI